MAQSDPFITKPQTKYVFTGYNVSLNCGVWNGDSTVQWRTPRGLVADNVQGVFPTYRSYYDLQVPMANHYLLVVLRARSHDAGKYSCSTFDDTGTTADAYADIAVISKQFKIFATHQRSCGKVMFLQACICPQRGCMPFQMGWVCLVHGPFWELVCPVQGPFWGWVCLAKCPFQQVDMPGSSSLPKRWVCLAHLPQEDTPSRR